MVEQLAFEIDDRSTELECPSCERTFHTHLASQVYCCHDCSLMGGVVKSFCVPCGEQRRPFSEDMTEEEKFARFFHRPSKSEIDDFKIKHQPCKIAYLEKSDLPPTCFCVRCKRKRAEMGVKPSPYAPAPSTRPARNTSYKKHRAEVLERDNYICQLCGYPTDPNARPSEDAYPTLDHDHPLSWGGSNELENLYTAHKYCNSVKGHDPHSWRIKLVVEDLESRYGHLVMPDSSKK